MQATATCDWYEMKDKLYDALTEKLGYPGLAMFEQVAWKSYDSGRCAECGATGEVKFGRPMLAQAVPHYWLCWDCDEHYRVTVGGKKPRVRTV